MNEVIGSDQNFDSEVLKSSLPVLVDFYADWCGPCRMVAPVVASLATKLAGKLKVVKINTDQCQNTAGKFGIMSIPTLIIFKAGKEVDRIVGYQGPEALEAKVNKYL
jgi:thioredoxin 1